MCTHNNDLPFPPTLLRFIDSKSGTMGRLAATLMLGPGGYDRVKKQVWSMRLHGTL
jgi:hypothetical protein